MAGVGGGGLEEKKVSPASAIVHTRKDSPKTSTFGVVGRILVILLVGISAWAFQTMIPPQPKICGSIDGPPITAPRIKLRDGRHLAYKEFGLPRDKAKHKFIFVHGFDSCRHHVPIALLSPEMYDKCGIYIVSFDRPGYGESDPHPTRTPKSLALDIEQLADQLELGPKFYVTGFSMGGQVIWTCLKYIPHRLLGATLLTPVVNYWWDGLPKNLTSEAFTMQLKQDQWAVWIAHNFPSLTYWWNTQKWFPPSSVIAHSLDILSKQDLEIIKQIPKDEAFGSGLPRQQGEYESIHRDMNIGFGTWEFSPLDLTNPFPNGEGTVHLWQGDQDGLVPETLQRYIGKQIPWIQYHELPGSGHLFPIAKGMADNIIKAQLSVQN